MAIIIDNLLALQDCDCRIVKLQREFRDIPTRKQEIESRLKEHREAVAAAKDAQRAKQSEIKQIELEIDAQKQRIAKFREQQMQLKSNKEFKAMESEVDGCQAQIARLEDQVLERMMGVDALGGDVRARETELKAEEQVVLQEVGVMDQRMKAIEAEVAKLEAERQPLAAGVDPEWLREYDRIFQNRKERAVVPIENGVCGGCHLKLPPYVSHEARKRSGMIHCAFCGRMLY